MFGTQVSHTKLQLIGSVCMLLAAKYEEIYAPTIEQFIAISEKAYTREQIVVRWARCSCSRYPACEFGVAGLKPTVRVFGWLPRTLRASTYCFVSLSADRLFVLVQKMETLILGTLSFHITVVSPLRFLERYLKASKTCFFSPLPPCLLCLASFPLLPCLPTAALCRSASSLPFLRPSSVCLFATSN